MGVPKGEGAFYTAGLIGGMQLRFLIVIRIDSIYILSDFFLNHMYSGNSWIKMK